MQQFQDDIFRLKMRADKMEKLFEEKVGELTQIIQKLESRVVYLEGELKKKPRSSQK